MCTFVGTAQRDMKMVGSKEGIISLPRSNLLKTTVMHLVNTFSFSFFEDGKFLTFLEYSDNP